jgi:hypothetical protein
MALFQPPRQSYYRCSRTDLQTSPPLGHYVEYNCVQVYILEIYCAAGSIFAGLWFHTGLAGHTRFWHRTAS